MVATPAYIIGLGPFGTNVVTAVRDRSRELATDNVAEFGFMSVAADHSILDDKYDVTTVPLTSDSGVVGDPLSSYPFLAEDIAVPATQSVYRRHVGRYKFDNPVSPAFQDYFKTLYRHLGRFLAQQETGVWTSLPETCTVVVVSSLADGTGGGALPLVTAAIDSLAESFDAKLRLVGLGVVPPLDMNPTESYPPVEPASYLNTYASFRNLITLTETEGEDSLDVPFYSWGSPDEQSASVPEEKPTSEPRKTLTVSVPPFDAYWLMSHAVESGETQSDDFATTVGHALHATLGYTSQIEGYQRTLNDSPLGTLGYTALGVPHDSVRQFCECKRERERRRSRLEEFVEPRIGALNDREQEIQRTLRVQVDTSPLVPKLIERVYDCLDEDPTDDYGFVSNTTPDELADALDTLADQSNLCSYFLTTSALEWSLSGGRIDTEARARVSQTVETVQEEHGLSLATSRADRLSALEQIDAAAEELERRRKQAKKRSLEVHEPVRDFLPPINELFTSTREQQEHDLRRIDESLARLQSCRTILERLDELHALSKERAQSAGDQVRDELETTREELSHYRSRAATLTERIEQLTEEVATLRAELTTQRRDGHRTLLPLDRTVLAELTVEEVDTLSSLSDYKEHGLLCVSQDELVKKIVQHCTESRNWPEMIARHDRVVALDGYDETAVLYTHANEPVIDAARLSAAVPHLCLPLRADTEYTGDPYLIEIVSTSQGGRFSSLEGFERLTDLKQRGVLQALAGPYRDYRRALAYPEWYDDIDSAFD